MPKNGGTHALKWTTTPGAAEREGRGGDGRTRRRRTDGRGGDGRRRTRSRRNDGGVGPRKRTHPEIAELWKWMATTARLKVFLLQVFPVTGLLERFFIFNPAVHDSIPSNIPMIVITKTEPQTHCPDFIQSKAIVREHSTPPERRIDIEIVGQSSEGQSSAYLK